MSLMDELVAITKDAEKVESVKVTFDHVACETISQEKLFKVACLLMVENCMSGYNNCMDWYLRIASPSALAPARCSSFSSSQLQKRKKIRRISNRKKELLETFRAKLASKSGN